MRRWHLASLCVLLFALTCAAQDVPPPPKPTDTPPSIDTTAKFLQDKLMSIGRVNWKETARNTKTGEVTGPAPAWEEVARVTVNPRTCEMRVTWRSSVEGEGSGTLYLEEADTVVVLTGEEYTSRSHPGMQYTMSPMPYSVVTPGGDFKVRDQQTANEIADALRQLAQKCAVIPPPAATGGPSLEETLSFIEDRLNRQGAVNWLSTAQDTVAGTSGSPTQVTVQISNATGDPRRCRLVLHDKTTAGGKVVLDVDLTLTFRRIEKLAVMTLQDANNNSHASQGHPELIESISPVTTYDLVVTDAANRAWDFPFADQDLANRVAKAMLHAVELCGGGKEPF